MPIFREGSIHQPNTAMKGAWQTLSRTLEILFYEKCRECWFWKPKQMVAWHLLLSIREAKHGEASRMASPCYFDWFYQEQNEWNQKEALLKQWRETHFSQGSYLVSSPWNRWDACRPCGMQCVGTITSPVIWCIDVISAFSLFDWQCSSSAAKNVILDQKAAPQPMDRKDWACQQISLSEKPEEEWCSLQVWEEEHIQKNLITSYEQFPLLSYSSEPKTSGIRWCTIIVSSKLSSLKTHPCLLSFTIFTQYYTKHYSSLNLLPFEYDSSQWFSASGSLMIFSQ